MKTLYLVRHAKSSWKYEVDDHMRPLKKRGHNDATLVSEKVKNEIEPPQKILTSDANRARTTAEYFKNALSISDDNYELTHDLYDFSGQQVMQVIKSLDNSLDKVMIVGHNHAFTSTVNMMGSEKIENLPTSGFVMIEFDEDDWKDVSTGTTQKMVFPRHLK
ncbi:MAG: histidine phosphatase family protein [Flavobacteriaceae bacterium]|jgi:phosphohistidine phosphatase|nr:histidine phosphatase family protein [Flavobacteriaceae bacterium]HBY67818.1 histidine phosphatase family protein [Flavobacteriaceae bacterium]|tara:strand:- start:347 stop:832 length:486 start_codon:yes stop_codon:yes gene_type:complete